MIRKFLEIVFGVLLGLAIVAVLSNLKSSDTQTCVNKAEVTSRSNDVHRKSNYNPGTFESEQKRTM